MLFFYFELIKGSAKLSNYLNLKVSFPLQNSPNNTKIILNNYSNTIYQEGLNKVIRTQFYYLRFSSQCLYHYMSYISILITLILFLQNVWIYYQADSQNNPLEICQSSSLCWQILGKTVTKKKIKFSVFLTYIHRFIGFQIITQIPCAKFQIVNWLSLPWMLMLCKKILLCTFTDT